MFSSEPIPLAYHILNTEEEEKQNDVLVEKNPIYFKKSFIFYFFYIAWFTLQVTPNKISLERYVKNPAYGRHWFSQPMRIVAPIAKYTGFFWWGGQTFFWGGIQKNNNKKSMGGFNFFLSFLGGSNFFEKKFFKK